MKLARHIAWRYLFSKKKHNAINIISAISVCGIALATLTLVCTLSVFNGFQESVASFFTAFDPDLKVVATTGKTFDLDTSTREAIEQLEGVDLITCTLEENAMLKYKQNQSMIKLKGVDDNFHHVTSINTLLIGKGSYILQDEIVNYGIMGVELASNLHTGIQPVQALEVYTPKPGVRVNMSNPAASFNTGFLYSPGVLFAVNQPKYDANYLICSLAFAQELLGYEDKISAIEIKLTAHADLKKTRLAVQQIMGKRFKVLDQYQQQTDIFNIMKIEKLISFFFLIFILLIACFNIISSLSMLILEKKEDMQILINLGADNNFVAKVFLYEGRIITLIGTISGLLLGVALTLLQQEFGFIKLSGGYQFITTAYPVSLHLSDLLLIIATVVVVGFVSVWYPIQYLSKRILTQK